MSRDIDFSASTSGFCHKFGKFSSDTITVNTDIEFLELKIDTLTMTLTIAEEKMEKVILKCQNLLSHLHTALFWN